MSFINEKYRMVEMINGIDYQLKEFRKRELKICITSSFQSHSLPLLHIATRVLPDLEVIFIDTGFHFPETYAFRDKIVKQWDLNIINVTSDVSKHQQKDAADYFLYNSKPDYCCYINKVVPLDNILKNYDVWIAGLRKSQTDHRATLSSIEIQSTGLIKYHPIIEWSSKMIYDYQIMHDLPRHPLEDKGYLSIGCLPCTRNAFDDSGRDARWTGSNKTECGIHLNN